GLRAGLPLPFSCTMGGCGHCRVTRQSGDIAMDQPNCLTEAEVASGAVLACCAYPHGRVAVSVGERLP
ncbi:MAG: 2Fe-2S iron-sulfur cluster binding domain-containing protein, partial [Moraxellaceae bacterium]|nr:2Fe-2S iron-sulfur cluster binding domain-containing protein [Moraxellaceae bacterium]